MHIFALLNLFQLSSHFKPSRISESLSLGGICSPSFPCIPAYPHSSGTANKCTLVPGRLVLPAHRNASQPSVNTTTDPEHKMPYEMQIKSAAWSRVGLRLLIVYARLLCPQTAFVSCTLAAVQLHVRQASAAGRRYSLPLTPTRPHSAPPALHSVPAAMTASSVFGINGWFLCGILYLVPGPVLASLLTAVDSRPQGVTPPSLQPTTTNGSQNRNIQHVQ